MHSILWSRAREDERMVTMREKYVFEVIYHRDVFDIYYFPWISFMPFLLHGMVSLMKTMKMSTRATY